VTAYRSRPQAGYMGSEVRSAHKDSLQRRKLASKIQGQRQAAKCFRPCRAGASKLPGASLTLRAWPLPQTEGWKTSDWSNPGCRFAVEVDQGEFLYSRIFSIRWVSETLSHRTFHPPMLHF
jgi:hypothetical protein